MLPLSRVKAMYTSCRRAISVHHLMFSLRVRFVGPKSYKYWCSSSGEDGGDSERPSRSSRAHHHHHHHYHEGTEQDDRRGAGALAADSIAVNDGMQGIHQAAPTDPIVPAPAATDPRRLQSPSHTVEGPSGDALTAEALATPRLAPRPTSGLDSEGDEFSQQATSASRGGEMQASHRLEQQRRLPTHRPPRNMPNAIPARIVSEATSSGGVSDMSEDEGDRPRRIPASDNELSETEHGPIRGPPAAPVRTDIAGRPLPPPVIAGTGMDLNVGAGVNGGVGLDADDSFGERFIDHLDAKFGQGNIDQITWRGQTPTQGIEDESLASPTRELFHQQNSSNGVPEVDTDGEEGVANRRRGTLTQAGYAPRNMPSVPTDGRDQLRSVSSTMQTGAPNDGFARPTPGLGLPSGRQLNAFRSASTINTAGDALHHGDRPAGGTFNSVRRVPSSDLPSTEQQRMWQMSRSQLRPSADDEPLPPWIDSATRDSILRGRAALQGHSRAMNHHQHLLMRGDIAAGMMGRSTTPNPDPTLGTASPAGMTGSHYPGASSTLSSPAGRANGPRLVPGSDFVDDQDTPLSERSDPMQMAEQHSGTESRMGQGPDGGNASMYATAAAQQQFLQQAPGFAEWMAGQQRRSADVQSAPLSNLAAPQQVPMGGHHSRSPHGDRFGRPSTQFRMGQADSVSRTPWNSTDARLSSSYDRHESGSAGGATHSAAFWNMLQQDDRLNSQGDRQAGSGRGPGTQDVEMENA